ncbi:MAG: hypothetical protein ACXW4L_00875 [Candidatus Limnocylindrales bacterium]
MPAFATALGILLVVVSIPFGLMVAPLALGIIVIFLGWRHVSAGLQSSADGAPA